MNDNIGLRVAGVAIILCLVAVPFGMSVNAESDYEIIDKNMQACYTTTDTINYRDSRINASLAVGTWDCHWAGERDSWEYNFKIGGMGVSGIDCIDYASLKVQGPSDNSEIRISDLEAYIWSTPRSEEFETDMMKGFSTLVVDVLLALVPIDDAFEDAWTVASDVTNLIGIGCDHLDDDRLNYRDYSWEWTSGISETAQQVWIIADLDPNVTQSFEVEYTLGGDFGSITTSALRLTMTSPETAGNPSNMTLSEREAAGIVTVQRDDLIPSAAELNLSPEGVARLLSTDEQEFYFATSIPTCEIITTSEDGSEDVQPAMDVLDIGMIINTSGQMSPVSISRAEQMRTGYRI